MAEEDGSKPSVLTRSFASIRDAFTGKPSKAGQSQDDAGQNQDGAVQSQDDAGQNQNGAAQSQDDAGQGHEGTERLQEDPTQADPEPRQGDTEQSQEEAEVPRTAAEGTSDPSQRKAEEYADIMQQCAAGDLTTRMEATGEDEAMDRIAVEFNDMVKELEKTTDQLKSYVDEVESAGVGVERSSDTVRRASSDVVDAMQNISADAEAQREQLQTISETMEGVAASLEQFAASHPGGDFEPQVTQLEEKASEIRDVAQASETIQTETTIVSAATEEQAAELGEMSSRAADLQRYAKPLHAILDRFDTESEHELVFSAGSATGNEADGTGD